MPLFSAFSPSCSSLWHGLPRGSDSFSCPIRISFKYHLSQESFLTTLTKAAPATPPAPQGLPLPRAPLSKSLLICRLRV